MKKHTLPVLFWTLFIDMVGIGMVFPVIPVLLTDPSSPSFLLTGYSTSMQYFVAGLVTAVFGLMQFIAAPILGELSDAYGRKRLLTLGVGVLALGQMLFGFAIIIGSVPLLLISRMVAGFAGANFSIAQATIADVTKPEDRAKNFGLVGAAFGLGFIVGPLLGGWVLGLTGIASAPFFLAGAIGVVNLVSISLFLPETRTRAHQAHHFTLLKGVQNIRAAFTDVDARPVYGASFLMQLGFTFFTSFIGILLVDQYGFSATDVGTFFGVIGVWVVITQLVILRWVTRIYSERTILRISLLTLALGISLYPFMPSTLFVYLIIPLTAISNGLSIANMTSLISKGVSGDKQGAALGISGSLQALSAGTAPLLAGLGSSQFGLMTPFIVASLLIVSSWSVLFLRNTHRSGGAF